MKLARVTKKLLTLQAEWEIVKMRKMKYMRTILVLMVAFAAWSTVSGAERKDARCIEFLGMPLEGPADSVAARLKQMGFAEWGSSADGEGLHFRGNYYGIRSKLFVGVDATSGLVSSASVTIGPYNTKENLERNQKYFMQRLQKDYGPFSLRNGAYYNIDTYGIVKVSQDDSETGTYEIKVFYYPTTSYYKDALSRGLKGHVMEVVTDNPVAEEPIGQYDREGKLVSTDIVDRKYDEWGYLRSAVMTEKNGGQSRIEYVYDTEGLLVKRMLRNEDAGVRYVNEYTYDEDENIVNESQKVFDKNDKCVMSINLQNEFQEYDDNGNWTRNALKLTYWDKDTGTQQRTAIQRRLISYWED